MNGSGIVYGSAMVRSSTLNGCEAVPVEVEVAVEPGIESIVIVGLPDAAVLEARERVRCAVRVSGFTWPRARILVSLSPSSVKKCGTGYDLAIAAAILLATGQMSTALAKGLSFVGELALDGRVKPVRGMYCHALAAARAGLSIACSPRAVDAGSAGIEALGVNRLADLRSGLLRPIGKRAFESPVQRDLDLADVPGNAQAKRALQIAAAGGHGLLLVGPAGSCASMLASRVPSLMPPLEGGEREVTAAAWSAAGEDSSSVLAGTRPFRAPHFSITAAGLIGGGRPVAPGEVSLAHGGVLYLEGIEEFAPSTLQHLRAPAVEGRVLVARADGLVEMPARFLLVASARPCPCGNFGSLHSGCTCSARQVSAYQARLCGPLRGVFEMRVDLFPEATTKPREVGESKSRRDAVELAWQRGAWRRGTDGYAQGARSLLESCGLSDPDERWLEKAASRAQLSGREIASVLRVARTVADMDGRDAVCADDLAEALSLRFR